MESKELSLKQFHLILLMFLLFLGGCAQRITAPDEHLQQNRPESYNNWRATGKLAFISPEERQSANFNWQYRAQKQTLTLNTFIGTQVLKLEEFDQHSELTLEDNTYTSADSSDLVYRLSGWQLPVSQAPQWLTGNIDAPGNQYNDKQQLTQATWQDEQGLRWQVAYQTYQRVNGLTLPTRLTLTHKDITIKIRISNWHFETL